MIIVFLYSCGGKLESLSDKNSIRIIDLTSQPKSELTMLSEISTKLDYIPLQTTQNSLVGSITKIITCNEKIYIKNASNEVLCFTNEGHFLYKLNNVGRGPEEYLFITDFDVSSENNSLFILSGGRILIFNNSGSEFIFQKSINLNKPFPSRLSLIPGTTNVLLSIDPVTGTEISLSMIISENGDTLNLKPNKYKYEKKDKFNRMMPNESLHFFFENNVCYKEEFSDTIFAINELSDEIFPRLVLNSHGQGISPHIRYDTEYAKAHANDFYWVYSLSETDRYVFYTYEHNMSRNRVVYDKSANIKYKIALKEALIDDILGGPNLNLDFFCEGVAYSSVEALTLKNYINSDTFKKKQVKESKRKEELKNLANTIDENDNPFLITINLKNR